VSKPMEDKRLKRHARVRFHRNPTYASWIYELGVWFSILSHTVLKGASMRLAGKSSKGIEEFVEVRSPGSGL